MRSKIARRARGAAHRHEAQVVRVAAISSERRRDRLPSLFCLSSRYGCGCGRLPLPLDAVAVGLRGQPALAAQTRDDHRPATGPVVAGARTVLGLPGGQRLGQVQPAGSVAGPALCR